MLITSEQTPKVALGFLLGCAPLVFGDISQIEALQILRIAEELIDLPRKCPECDGTGSVEYDHPGECSHCGRECPYCGSGHETCEMCKGNLTIKWSRDAVYALKPRTIMECLEKSKLLMAA